jgi:hypothetical protein
VRPDLFWSKVDQSGGPDACWPWLGKINRGGYGEYRQRGSRASLRYSWRAHRVAFELVIGPIPSGLVIDHLCRMRACVNPGHMEPVTHLENLRRGKRGGGQFSASELSQVATRYRCGESATAIAADYGVHRETVLNHLRRIGEPIRKRGRPLGRDAA